MDTNNKEPSRSLDELADLIEEQIDQLKPGLKERFVYQFSEEKANAYAVTMQSFVPPMITFYLKNIEKMTDKPMEQSIRELITHELIHVLQIPGYVTNEAEAQKRFQKLNFFQ